MNSSPRMLEKFMRRLEWDDIDKSALSKQFSFFLEEEVGRNNLGSPLTGDLTTKVCQINSKGKAKLVARENIIVCGLALVPLLFESFGLKKLDFETNASDGDEIRSGTEFARIQGFENQILLIERTMLNIIQRLSGIASKTKRFVRLASPYGVHFLDTRKTTPGLRQLEKYATACGGGKNHRLRLDGQILIKDNHLASKGIRSPIQLEDFLKKIRENQPDELIEVEIDDLEQLKAAMKSGIDAILLDNFEPERVHEAVQINQNKCILEASGGINESTIEKYARAKPHFISSGAPIHASRWLDIGLDWY